MPAADAAYLAPVLHELRQHWPRNRSVTIACHGHSIPAGYFATPRVDASNAYPRLLHDGLLQRFPFAVVNVVVTAIGGENSVQGAARFARDVLGFRPDVVTIDYAANDRGVGLAAAREAWTSMIRVALDAGTRVLLVTPVHDLTQTPGRPAAEAQPLRDHAEQIRALADEHGVGLVDAFADWTAYIAAHGELDDLLSWSNHPNRAGHERVARALLRWFPAA